MTKHSHNKIELRIEAQGLMPVFYHDDLELCKQILSCCYNAGIRIFEFTNRGEFAYQNFAELIRYTETELPEMILGAGTIMNAESALRFIKAGASFIVSPAFKKSVAEVCIENKIFWIPGCGSVTEISDAEDMGATIVKVFPGSVLGPEFIKAVKGPMPSAKMMVTGGVEPTEQSFRSWFNAGAICVGIGSQLFDTNKIGQGKFQELESEIKNALQMIQMIR